MENGRDEARAGTGPKRRQRHYSYNEAVDEPGKLLDDEPVEIEEERPAEDKRPVEGVEENAEPDSPAFEE